MLTRPSLSRLSLGGQSTVRIPATKEKQRMPNARCEVGPLRANPRAVTGVQMPRREPPHYRYEAL